MNAMFKHFQSTSGEAALEKYDQDDNIMSPRTSDISAAFDLTAKVIVLSIVVGDKNNVVNISSPPPSTCRWI